MESSPAKKQKLEKNKGLESLRSHISSTSPTSQARLDYNFNKYPNCKKELPPLKADENHTVLIEPSSSSDDSPRHVPNSYNDVWDEKHVQMPCSTKNFINMGNKTSESAWKIIKESLSQEITSSYELQEAIVKYNVPHGKKWDFSGFHYFFNTLKPKECDSFFTSTLPLVIKLAINLPSFFTQPIPLLKQHKDHKITLSQKQAGCLLANAFLCTFPNRNSKQKRTAKYPSINFNGLFVGSKEGITHRRAQKLRCIFNYFRRITTKEPVGTLTFHRHYMECLPDWPKSNKHLKYFAAQTKGLIEKDGEGMLQVDFADKLVGGLVLDNGCVQEEIRFVICPELITSRLFTEVLDDNEALVVTGCEQYSKYFGYGDKFTWNGDYIDVTLSDEWDRKYREIVAIDAYFFRNKSKQYEQDFLLREVNKAFVGFCETGVNENNLPALATGNWGCGIFKGDPELKSIIQWIAASEVDRDAIYFTFGKMELKTYIDNMHQLLKEHNATVGMLWSFLVSYGKKRNEQSGKKKIGFYDYVKHKIKK